MKAKIKIIDFGFSILLTKQNLASTMVGSPINMDPIILEKYNKLRDKSATYDNKVDIWSIGTVCYELLIGKAVFDATTMGSLVEKVREGSYRIPSTVSREIVSFLNDMLQYDPNNRLSAKQLQKHPFLVKDVKDFTYMNAERTTKDDKIKKNKSIWAVFKDEEKFINIKDNHNTNQNQNPIPEESKIGKEYQTKNVKHNHHHNNNMKQYKRSNTMTPQQNIYSFYGQQMTLNSPQQNTGYYPQTIQYNNIPQYTYNNTYPTFGVPLTYGYAQYNTQNQIQNIQNQGINYNYQNNNNAVDHQLRRAQSNYVIHPKTKKKVKEGGCFIF
jgi:serine/threonine protein kinase